MKTVLSILSATAMACVISSAYAAPQSQNTSQQPSLSGTTISSHFLQLAAVTPPSKPPVKDSSGKQSTDKARSE